MNSSIEKVDLFLGDRRSFHSPWVSYKDLVSFDSIDPQNVSIRSKPFKRIVRDFSLSLQTRSENGWLPSLSIPEIRRNNRVNRISVTIGAFSVRMTGEEFYRFLNVIRFTLLVNPTNPIIEESKTDNSSSVLRSAKKLSDDLLRSIESNVLKLVKCEDSVMLPYLKLKYTLVEVEWTLLTSKSQEIAVATLHGLTGEHIFCFDGKTESSIVLNDLQIVNPTYSVNDQRWKSPEVIFNPVILDRDKNDQNNILEIIAVTRKPLNCDGMTVSVFEHVGVNVFPGCHYYILFQLTSAVANGLLKYFFPEEDTSESEDGNDYINTEDTTNFPDNTMDEETSHSEGQRPSIVLEISGEDISVDGPGDVASICFTHS